MAARPQPPTRSHRERAVAWLYTGPLGHLYSVLADIAVLWARWAGSGLRRRAASRSGR